MQVSECNHGPNGSFFTSTEILGRPKGELSRAEVMWLLFTKANDLTIQQNRQFVPVHTMPLAPRYDIFGPEDPDSLPLASWLHRNKHGENSAPVQRATDEVPPALTYESDDSDSLPLVSWLYRNKYRQSNAVVQRAMDKSHRSRTYESEDSDNLPLSLWLSLQDIQETSVVVKKGRDLCFLVVIEQ
ncbi:hypothetical protein ISCGN_019805 [Ixodes scapularis]